MFPTIYIHYCIKFEPNIHTDMTIRTTFGQKRFGDVRQKTVPAYLYSEQILPFGFIEQEYIILRIWLTDKLAMYRLYI